MFFLALFDIMKKLPITAGKENAVMVIQMVSTTLHVLLNYLFVVQFDLKVRGTAQAMSITQLISLIILCVYSYSRKDLRESWFMPTSAVCKNVIPYVKLAAPSTVMICAAWWGFQFQFLVSSKISVTAAAVQVIMINICSFLYQIPAGISVAASILVGKSVGSQNVAQAKSYTRESLRIILIVATATSTLIYMFRE
jgi:MATE family multidrug resistance protein